MTRIDDAVTRILAVKFSMGLVNVVYKKVSTTEESSEAETEASKKTEAIPVVDRDVAASAALKAA